MLLILFHKTTEFQVLFTVEWGKKTKISFKSQRKVEI